MSTQPLLVPLQVDALVVDDRSRQGGTTFRRWIAVFKKLGHHEDPEPDPYTGETDFKSHPGNDGVYLQWRLPQAARTGRQLPDGTVDFPKIPNRWLVVRYSGSGTEPAQASSVWVVESDYLGDDGTSEFATRTDAPPKATGIGRKQELTRAKTPWKEPAPTAELFLDVLGPGIPTFSVYQPYNEDVLSLHDPLTDLVDAQVASKNVILGYCVLGWYSNTSQDPLSKPMPPDAVLRDVGWRAREATAELQHTLYQATVLGLRAAGPDGEKQSQPRPDPRAVTVAVGSCMEDALRALPTPTPLGESEEALRKRVLSALLHDTVEHLGTPDGDIRTEQAELSAQFRPHDNARLWSLTQAPATTTAAAPAADDDLIALNALQGRCEQAEQDLAQQRQRLVDLWWLVGMDAGGTHTTDLKRALDTALTATDTAQSAAATAAAARDEALRALRAVTEPTGYLVTDAPDAPFFHPEDPTIVLRGAHVTEPLTTTGPLDCRLAHQLITAIRDQTPPQGDPPGHEYLYPVPAPQQDLAHAALAEFARLDRAARDHTLETALANPTTHLDAPPPPWTAAWTQPWQPLMLNWRIHCVPLPMEEQGQSLWTFDGTHYGWNGHGAQTAYPISGRTTLTPLPGFALSRAAQRQAERGTNHPEHWARLAADALTQDLLSQQLTGLDAWYLQRRPMLRYLPSPQDPDTDTKAVAQRAGTTAQTTAAAPDAPCFEPVRAGQFYFDQLSIIDRFGQAVDIVRASTPIHTTRPPQHTLTGQDPTQLVELPPRLLHPTRLRLDAADPATDRTPPAAAPFPEPAGWLLPNRLDRSLVVYDPDGTQVLEIRRGAGDTNPPTPLTLPGTPRTNRTLERLLAWLNPFTNADLDQLLATIDTALTTTAATDQDLAGPAALAGRPLALIRVRAAIEVASPTPGPTGWKTILPEPPRNALDRPAWPLRLGEADLTRDGLIGYFLDTATDTLRSPHTAPGTGHRITDVAGNDPLLTVPSAAAPLTTGRMLTLLVSPGHPVHATSGLLPVTTLELPEALVRQHLARLSIPFSTDPLLTPPAPHPNTVIMPRPGAWSGRWQWLQRERTEPHTWATADDLVPATPTAAFTPQPATARSGFLQLRDAYADNQPRH
ncbi:hypothetical protein PUR28_27865 [Streptomyces sp. BE308]|uniref:hypothetical protein n=1 Tax=Streptomyces sp. BE308 TaxID=3002529 RepID=UPI002E77DBB9|nr:hypothetical protein [Streptomyces sp. BE308]MEE1794545.1 hypothetical protein [Streptomyces sp. BE308]